MKKTIFALICALGVLSFTSSDDLNNDNYEEYCNQSYVIDGGPGCIFNGPSYGWCSEAEFEEYAQSVYESEGCEAPVKKKNVPKLEP
ncbi:hypothetical protein KO504_02910 [Winogradskyella psychrotolerans]|uniref:hypothetical protein n=1 Tax=Winogradskyella psychrotolerans TaxID=1344585 RepID=UPI001C07798E|nr:hypothetical protein [Winogradskyella psychrotolerans]MBU2920277.1 hypothetical protein [Winogradskyella psychrotolerans]